MELNNEEKERYDNLSPVMKSAVTYMMDAIKAVIYGKCDEDVMINTMGTLNQNAQGRYNDEDLLNYDKAGKELGFGTTNRVGLKRFLDKNKIKQVLINNIRCGFSKAQINLLKDKYSEDIKERKARYKDKYVNNMKRIKRRGGV